MTIGEQLPRRELVEERGARFEIFQLPTDQETLLAILKDSVEEWDQIRIGLLIPGAIWEIRPPCEPSITLSNGYATVDFREWHIHICIGEKHAIPQELCSLRRTARVELYRRLTREDRPVSWGLRFLNGAGNHQISFMLPSPLPSDDQQIAGPLDWSHLALWDRVRQKYLRIAPDSVDLTGSEFCRG